MRDQVPPDQHLALKKCGERKERGRGGGRGEGGVSYIENSQHMYQLKDEPYLKQEGLR